MSVFGKVSKSVMLDPGISKEAKLVFSILSMYLDYNDRTKPVYPSIETIASLCPMSQTLVKKALKELVKKEIIRREPRYKKSALTYLLK